MPSRYTLSTKELTNLSESDVTQLSGKDLRQDVRQLADVITKGYKRAVQKGYGDIGVFGKWSKMADDNGRYSLKGKSEKDLQKDLLQFQKILSSKTYTEKGRQAIVKKLEKMTGESLTPGQYKTVWDTYDKFEELSEAGLIEGFFAINYKTLLKQITSDVVSNNVSNILDNAQQTLDDIYKDEQTKTEINVKEAERYANIAVELGYNPEDILL